MNRVAAIQMASGPNLAANLGEAERLITQAAGDGAELVVLPENFALMGKSEFDKLPIREKDDGGPIQDFLAAQADRHGIWLVGGTIPLSCTVPDKVYASCLLYDADGQRVSRYDKIHLFDVSIKENNEEQYSESTTIHPGQEVVVADTPLGRLGLAVCYDLRFPEQFRCLLNQGMEMVAIPAAFTAITGKAHWELLVRARAVENLCYVIAADQGGFHVGGRETHGESMIVDPWGIVVARLNRGPGVTLANMDRERLDSIRRSFPATEHRRLDCSTP